MLELLIKQIILIDLTLENSHSLLQTLPYKLDLR